MSKTSFTLVVPKLSDPRFLFLLFSYIFLMYVLQLPGFGHKYYEYLYLAFWCMLFDLLLRRYIEGTWAIPISGLIPAFGIFIVMDVTEFKYYIILAALAIGSKAFIRINGRHIFNPGNFAVVMASVAIPQVMCNGGFLRWDGNIIYSLLIAVLGAILAIRVNRWVAALSFIVSSVLWSPIQALFANENPFAYLHTLMWQGTLIFIFFMITDPKTSPNKKLYQFIYGVAVAAVSQIIRYTDARFPEFAALMIVCFIYAIVDKKTNDQKVANAWQTRQLQLDMGH